MALNFDLIGEKIELEPFTYDRDKVILYALSVGSGIDELDYIYEKNLKVLPTFAILPFMPGIKEFKVRSGVNMHHTLQLGHRLVLHRPIPLSGTLYSTAVWTDIYDKGDKGAIFNIDVDTWDKEGRLIFSNRFTAMDRKGGNFGGAPGPKNESVYLPVDTRPDFQLKFKTRPEQAALYRLHGDKNPMHIDPEFSKIHGFKQPILHGLCVCGFAVRALLKTVCNDDPTRFKSFSTRFKQPSYPGDTLTINGWKMTDSSFGLQVTTQDGRLVLDNFIAKIREDE